MAYKFYYNQFVVSPYNVRNRAQIYGVSTFTVELRDKNFNLVKILTKKVKDISWNYNRIGGCGNCDLSLAISFEELTDYINPDYEIRIFAALSGTSAELVYRGFVEDYRPKLSMPDGVQLSASGYIGQLKRVPVIRTYINAEISTIIKDILDQDILPNTSIFYEVSNIEDSGFVVDEIEFDTMADDAISTLARLAGNFEYGVNRNLDFYFKKKDTTIKHFVRVKNDVNAFDEINDYSNIINRYIIKGKDGFSDTVDNTESQTLYGVRTKIISNSSIITTAVSQRYGTMLIADSARIARRATLSLVNQSGLFEVNLPIGKLTILKEPISAAKKYGSFKYGASKYGALISYDIEEIKYSLDSIGLNAKIDLGQERPDITNQIERLEFEINQIRNF